jgi:hypothetical protein
MMPPSNCLTWAARSTATILSNRCANMAELLVPIWDLFTRSIGLPAVAYRHGGTPAREPVEG